MIVRSGRPSVWRRWFWEWPADRRKTIYLCAAMAAICGTALGAYVQKALTAYHAQTPGHPAAYGDFFALWSYAEIARTHPVRQLYDSAAVHQYQVALGMPADVQNPFPYPPIFILMVRALGVLPYDLSYLAWMAVTFALFVWAVAGTCSRLPASVLAAAVAPVVSANIAAGQSGFLSGALMVAGIRLAPVRPVLGGVLLGCLSYKPQLGLLLPVALLAGRLWAATLAAAVTALGLMEAATLVYGQTIWWDWLAMLPAYSDLFDRTIVGQKYMATITAAVRVAGFSSGAAAAAQAVCGGLAALLVGLCFRDGETKLASAALLVGTFLATPHAFVYDMPMLAAAIALYIDARLETDSGFNLIEVLVLGALMLFPGLMMVGSLDARASIPPLVGMFGLILWRAQGRQRGSLLGGSLLRVRDGA
ncbi:MAG TPA: glycosyltransferase family 87 protein [Rhodopila sp.]|nr:glycosyltransferase family 87 protein [Rhodopila sp.]